MARFYPVSPLFWSDREVKTWLREDDAPPMLALYFLTCSHRNLEGLYHLPTAYIEADLCWSQDKVQAAMSKLLDQGFIQYDPEAEVVFVRNALKYQAPASANQIKGAIAALQTVPATPLLDALVDAAATHAPEFAKALRKALPSHSEGIGK